MSGGFRVFPAKRSPLPRQRTSGGEPEVLPTLRRRCRADWAWRMPIRYGLGRILTLYQFNPRALGAFDEGEAHLRAARQREVPGLRRHLDVLGFHLDHDVVDVDRPEADV